MTTIISKYGYGEPASGELAKGEIGIDLTDGIIYSSTDGSDIIELGRGEIQWDNIVGVPPELIVGGDGYINLTELEARVTDNEGDIADLKKAVGELQDAVGALEGRMDDAEEAIEINAGKIQSNTNAISTLDSQINDEDGLVDQINANKDGVASNLEKIESIEAILNQDLTGLKLAGTYDVPNNTVQDVTETGTAAGIKAGDSLTTHSKAGNEGLYFVCAGEGVLAGTQRQGSDGQYAQNGDWLVCDGVHGWILMSFGGDHTSWGAIGGDINNQTDLMEEFAKYIKHTDTINCGTYTAK